MASFQAFAETCQNIEETRKISDKADKLASFIKGLTNEEFAIAVNFFMGIIFPPDDLILGAGQSTLCSAIKLASGLKRDQLDIMRREMGDPGLVASIALENNSKASSLTITDVYQEFETISMASGKMSSESKAQSLKDLFSEASPLEALYLARLIMGNMRIGVGKGIVRDAISKAFDQPVQLVDRGYSLTDNMGLVAVRAKEGSLSKINIALNRPIKMMLPQGGESFSSAIENQRAVAVEWKFDGSRVQIHKNDGKVQIFSRQLENVTSSLPDICRAILQNIKANSAILDGEAVAVGPDGRPKPFQEVLKRFHRKRNVNEVAAQVPLRLYLFDLIYLDGKGTVDLPLSKRRDLLVEHATSDIVAGQILTDNPTEAEKIYRSALNAGHEGVVIKNVQSPYIPGKRTGDWLKFKAALEVLDLVVVGATWGKGRRAGLLSSYRLACLDEDAGKLLEIGKVSSGMTDRELEDLTEIFKGLITGQRVMEVAIKPSVVFEVACGEIQKSPSSSSGYALRFPRLVTVRTDKSPGEADTLEKVSEIYNRQKASL